ncbi:GGDEF domain-containing protein [Edaphobacter modestus]|uniref:Diguanylate cyclase (GGDEF)-like protein n=1 Tax=Edaphobacter modestus TaxID=388466 RepID=A0A4Q7Z158_9BACT|nr:GGDEF domain-containing protein [Edaphobacter modestus]RZU43361.1 diguanylate cyclase (GGDEF)-like protein [Edaphobacter modestus]
MNYAFLPDLLALTILIVILLLLRRDHAQRQTNLWLLGLFFTLIESSAHIFYGPNGPPGTTLHTIVIVCYLLAGLVFVWASGNYEITDRKSFLFLLINSVPLLALCATYGLHLFSKTAFLPWIALGLILGVATSLYLRRSLITALVLAIGWLGMGLLASDGRYRQVVYWCLGVVYAVATVNFYRKLPRNSTGRLAIITGFSIWAFFFFLHPFIVTYRTYADIASHIWNMQKSLISIGMILVMLEEQVSNNRWLALHDELTGLANRRSFEDRLSIALDRCRRARSTLALFMLDLDGFKQINDTHGHHAGDQLLRHVAGNLREHVGHIDSIARVGGDEFTLLACDPSLVRSVEQLRDAIREATELPFFFDGHKLSVTASIGIALYPDDADDATRLLRIADLRMYSLKQERTPLRHIRLDSVPSLTASGRFRSRTASGRF